MKTNTISELNGVDNELTTCSNGIPKFLLKKTTNQMVSGISSTELIREYLQCLIPSDIQIIRNESVKNVSRNEQTTATHPLIATDFKSYP